MTRKKAGTVSSAIEEIIRQRLSGVKITQIDIKEDTDFLGDDIFRINVIYDEKISSIDPKKALGMVRLIRSGLEGRSERFPILSYISRSDARSEGIASR